MLLCCLCIFVVLSYSDAKDPLLVWSNSRSNSRTSGIFSAPALPENQKFLHDFIVSKRIVSLRLPHSITAFDSIDANREIAIMDVGRGNLAVVGLDSANLKRNHRGITTSAKAVAVDWKTGNIYWSDEKHGWIFTTTSNFKHSKPVIRNIGAPRGIAVNPEEGLLFWSQLENGNKEGKIMRSTLSGGAQQIIAHVKGIPTAVALDYKTDIIYWIDVSDMSVCYSNIDGKDSPNLLFRNRSLIIKDLHVFREWLYITSTSSNEILVLNKTSGDVIQIIRTPAPIAVSVIGGGSQPKTSGPCDINNGGCKHFCFAQPPGNMRKCACSIGMTLESDGTSCTSNVIKKDFLLVVDSDMRWIFQLSYNRTSYTKLDLPGLVIPVQAEYDQTTARIYWTDIGSTSINRANIDGSNHVILAKENVHQPTGLSLDETSRNLYWTDEGIGTINVIRTDGTHRKTLMSKNISLPRGLVIDPNSGLMWWSDWGKKTIEKSNMDGTGRVIIIDRGIEWINGLTLDKSGGKIYWCDAKRGVIESLDLNGSNRQIVKTFAKDESHIFGISIFKGFLYWSDWNKSIISRMRINATVSEDFGPRIFDKASDVHSFYETPTRQKVINPCQIANGNCTGLCIPVPKQQHDNDDSYTTTRVCMCGNDQVGECDHPTQGTDGIPPTFNGTCPQTMTFIAPACSKQVLVNYTMPRAFDNLGKVLLELPLRPPPVNLSEGSYEHRYTAVDKAGNHDTCIVLIVVKVIRCPEIRDLFKNTIIEVGNDFCGEIFGSRVSVTCTDGISNEGSEFLECDQNGIWIGQPVCSSSTDSTVKPEIQTPPSTSGNLPARDGSDTPSGYKLKDANKGLPLPTSASNVSFPFLFVIPIIAALLLSSACAVGYRYHRKNSLPLMEAMEKTLSYRKNDGDIFTLDVSDQLPQTATSTSEDHISVAGTSHNENELNSHAHSSYEAPS